MPRAYLPAPQPTLRCPSGAVFPPFSPRGSPCLRGGGGGNGGSGGRSRAPGLNAEWKGGASVAARKRRLRLAAAAWPVLHASTASPPPPPLLLGCWRADSTPAAAAQQQPSSCTAEGGDVTQSLTLDTPKPERTERSHGRARTRSDFGSQSPAASASPV